MSKYGNHNSDEHKISGIYSGTDDSKSNKKGNSEGGNKRSSTSDSHNKSKGSCSSNSMVMALGNYEGKGNGKEGRRKKGRKVEAGKRGGASQADKSLPQSTCAATGSTCHSIVLYDMPWHW